MAPLQAEAAWQLGEWKQLEEFTLLRNDKQLQQPDNTMVIFYLFYFLSGLFNPKSKDKQLEMKL